VNDIAVEIERAKDYQLNHMTWTNLRHEIDNSINSAAMAKLNFHPANA